MISGVRADMALRLQYDDIPIGKIDTNISKALEDFINTNPDEPKQVFVATRAMTAIRRLLRQKKPTWKKYHNENNNCAALSARDVCV